MKIYRCDKCGAEWFSEKGIVGNEYDYHKKFETVAPAYRQDGIVDLCNVCFRKLEDVILEEKHDTRSRILARAKEWLSA